RRVRIPECWALRQPSHERRFGQRQVARRLAEIGAGGGLNAVREVAVEYLVEIKLEDLVLADGSRQLLSQDNLPNPAAECTLRALFFVEQGGAHELLGNRAGARDYFPLLRGLHDGPRHAYRVKAGILVKARILRGNRRADHVGRDLVEGDVAPVTQAGTGERIKLVTGAVIDHGRLKLADLLLEIGNVGQVRGDGGVADDSGNPGEGDTHDDG